MNGSKAADTNKERYGEDFYARIQEKRKVKFVPPPINSERAREIAKIRWAKHKDATDNTRKHSEPKKSQDHIG